MAEQDQLAAEIDFHKSISELWRQVKGDGASAHPMIQFLKYGFVGGAATGVDMFVFFLAAWFLFPALTQDDLFVRLLGLFGISVPIVEIEPSVRANRQLLCNLVAFGFSNTFCYVINALWVFKPGRHSRSKEFMLFLTASAISSGSGILIADVLVRWFAMQTSVSYIAKIVASVMINYIARKKIVFQD